MKEPEPQYDFFSATFSDHETGVQAISSHVSAERQEIHATAKVRRDVAFQPHERVMCCSCFVFNSPLY